MDFFLVVLSVSVGIVIGFIYCKTDYLKGIEKEKKWNKMYGPIHSRLLKFLREKKMNCEGDLEKRYTKAYQHIDMVISRYRNIFLHSFLSRDGEVALFHQFLELMLDELENKENGSNR